MRNRLSSTITLDESTFEYLLHQLRQIKKDSGEMVEIDLRNLKFIDPYGMLGLLELGCHLNRIGLNSRLILPQQEEVLRYLERMDFWSKALDFYQIDFSNKKIPPLKQLPPNPHFEVLLEITKIEEREDIHSLIDKVRTRAEAIFASNLNYNPRAMDCFLAVLAEICQNIPEHSEDLGYVGIQKYFSEKRIGKNMVKIAVMDLGRGIKESLSPRYASFYQKNWSDYMALKLVLFEGASRYDDPEKGQGLGRVRQLVEKWNGKLTLRSGTTKLGIIPNWESGLKKQTSLYFLPGTQISIILPEFSER